MKFTLSAIVLSLGAIAAAAQVPSGTPLPSTPKISELLAKNLESYSPNAEVPRDKREQAYAKLLEAQRYIWRSNPARGQTGGATNVRLAKAALQKALEIDPGLAEAYTALAELSLSSPPNDVDEAIALASMATKINPDNFGGHRILARLYTYKSRLNNGSLDQTFAGKAIAEWKEIARLDPRNAEAWAFLAEFYEQAGKPDDQIEALKKWLASATPLDTYFYRKTIGGRADLSPESASLKLGPALMKAGRIQEAVEVLSLVVADEPENQEAIDRLKEALETADSKTAASAIESLQQAVYANPGNIALLNLLAQVEWRAGKTEDAIKVLTTASDKLAGSDRVSASSLQVSVGELYASADRFAEAISAFEKALKVRGLDKVQTVADEDRDFAMAVFEKLIQVYKRANRPDEARAVIDRARKLLGKDDLFADRQMISLYREMGRKAEALAAVRQIRLRMPNDYGLLRLEASILTENGRVDEAVSLVKKLFPAKPGIGMSTGNSSGPGASTISVMPSVYDDFSNYLFISQLYNEANRGKDAIAAARHAYEIAKSEETRQIAMLTVASAQQISGDFTGAETTLREILKQTPGNPIALNNLGYFLLERNERIEEAQEMIQQAVRVDPNNPSYLDSLGWAYFKQGKFAEAEKYLKDAARLDTASATIQEHLGDVYEKQGKVELARSAWHKALLLGSEVGDLNRLKGKIAGVVSK